jgi:hypothetical protein
MNHITLAIGTTIEQVRPTARDKDGQLTQLAIAQLKEAQKTRQNYDDLLRAAIKEHGDVWGTPTSGCYNPAFPEPIKDELRTLAHNISQQVEHARSLWRKAGRRINTLRPFQDAAYRLKDGRVSYY